MCNSPDVLLFVLGLVKCICQWLDRYKDALVLLLREVLNRIQFRYNQAQLEELDDETLDDDVRTIYISYIIHNLSLAPFYLMLLALCIFCSCIKSSEGLMYINSFRT